MKKVLLIGGTGTISTPIMENLAKDTMIDLYVLNRGNRSQNLPKGVHHLVGDIRKDAAGVKQLVKEMSFDSVINFVVMSEKDAQINYALWKGKTKQFIFISTVVTLDHATTCRIDETVNMGNRISLYGQAKAACERFFMEKYEQEGFPVTFIRPTQTYSNARIPLSVKGKTCWSVIARMLEGKEVIVHGDGQSIWASTHANDFAKGFLPCVANEKTIGECYQIMNPEAHTWDMVYQTLAELLHVEYRPVYISSYLLANAKAYDFKESILGDKMFSSLFNISKIKSIVPDFHCDIDLKTGLCMYLQYMEEHPELQVKDAEFDEWCEDTIQAYKESMQQFRDRIR